MKSTTLREAKAQLSQCVDESQKESVLITRHGKPAALVIGLEGYDFEDVFYMTNRSFWRTIRSRRKQKSIPWKRSS